MLYPYRQWLLESGRLPLLPALLLAAAVVGSCGGEGGGPPDGPDFRHRPNVILIVVDTLRPDHLSSHGCAHRTSPHLDRLAGDSVVFRRAYSTAPWTFPSIASMMTGYHPVVLGIRKKAVRIPEGFTTLAELFRGNGYRTTGIVSHTYVKASFGLGQGFEAYDEDEARGGYHLSSPGVTRRAVEFLRAEDPRPFFLFLHYFDPHYNFVLHDLYNSHPDYRGPLLEKTVIHGQRKLAEAGLLDGEDRRYLRSLYDGEIGFTDFHLGRLLRQLKRLGLYDDSLIVFTADHGEEFAERRDNWIGHTRRVTEAMIRVPLMVKLPRGGPRHLIHRPVSLVDLMPTIASCAGIEPPGSEPLPGTGIDLDHATENPRVVFAETEHKKYKYQTVIHGHWKLVHDRKQGGYQLFNLEQDPRETEDLSGSEPDVLAQMRGRHGEWLGQLSAQGGEQESGDEEPRLSSGEIEQLRALGYVD